LFNAIDLDALLARRKAMKRLAATSRGKTRRGKRTWIQTLDVIIAHCAAVETLAGLLEACDCRVAQPELMRNAGGLINREIDQMRELLNAWEG
jgi:hypothetical protein